LTRAIFAEKKSNIKICKSSFPEYIDLLRPHLIRTTCFETYRSCKRSTDEQSCQ